MATETDTITLEMLGRQLQRVLDRINAFEQNIPLQLKAIDARMASVEARISSVDARLGSVDARLAQIDPRFDQQDLKFLRIEENLDAIANRLVQIAADVKPKS